MSETPKLSIIIPAYNEEKRIRKTLIKYHNYFSRKYGGNDFEMVIVTDGCKDKTPDIAREFSQRFQKIEHLNFARRLGKGGAIIHGIRSSNGKLIGFVDADGSVSPQEFNVLIENMEDCDGAIGSRWCGSPRVVGLSFSRKFWSRVLNLAVKALFGLHFEDTQCGAKVFKREAIRRTIDEIQTSGFAFDVDLLYRLKRRGLRVKEVPIAYRHVNESSVEMKSDILGIALSVIRLRMLTSSLKRIGETIFKLSIFRHLMREYSDRFPQP